MVLGRMVPRRRLVVTDVGGGRSRGRGRLRSVRGGDGRIQVWSDNRSVDAGYSLEGQNSLGGHPRAEPLANRAMGDAKFIRDLTDQSTMGFDEFEQVAHGVIDSRTINNGQGEFDSRSTFRLKAQSCIVSGNLRGTQWPGRLPIRKHQHPGTIFTSGAFIAERHWNP